MIDYLETDREVWTDSVMEDHMQMFRDYIAFFREHALKEKKKIVVYEPVSPLFSTIEVEGKKTFLKTFETVAQAAAGVSEIRKIEITSILNAKRKKRRNLKNKT